VQVRTPLLNAVIARSNEAEPTVDRRGAAISSTSLVDADTLTTAVAALSTTLRRHDDAPMTEESDDPH
jgi:hypothetical protein